MFAEYTGGRQSEPSKCDTVGPSRHRETKKEHPHGCTCKTVNTQLFNTESEKIYGIHNFSSCLTYVSIHSHVVKCCLFTNLINSIE